MSKPPATSKVARRVLGNTGLSVSEIGLGCWGIGGPMRRDGTVSGYGAVDDCESLAMLREAIHARGVNFFDTAPWYGDGHSERLVGAAVRACGGRDQVVISTKVGIYLADGKYTADYSGEFIFAHYAHSLERLGTEYIDVYVLHSPTRELYRSDGLEALKELKRRGIIKAFGISLPASHRECEDFFLPVCEQEGVEVVQVSFNLLHWMARLRILPKLAALGVGVVCREAFYYGYLTGRFTRETTFDRDSDVRSTWPRELHTSYVEAAEKFKFLHQESGGTPAQAALRYCLSRPEIATVIPGAMTRVELDENLAIGDARLSPELVKRVEELQEYEIGEGF